MATQWVFQGKKFQVSSEPVTLPNGTVVQKEIVHHGGAVVILPLLDQERIVLVRVYRHALGETLLELPAGTIDHGEQPDATAVRELAEETGYRAGRWRKLREFYPSPGILTEVMHLYVAEDLQPGPQDLDEGEQLVPEITSWADAQRLVLDGTIRDGKTLVGLLLWDRLRSRA